MWLKKYKVIKSLEKSSEEIGKKQENQDGGRKT
jgi:hypothetical protein